MNRDAETVPAHHETPDVAELRRDAESWLMIGGERVLPLLNALDAARAERDALAAKLDAVRALHGPRVVQVLGATCSAEECDHEDACRLGDGDCTCPNPYRTKGETDE